MKKNVLIIGAGKIGRGFIAHLFYVSVYNIWLLDASKDVIDLLNKEKKYRVDLAGEENDITEYIFIEAAFTLDDKTKVEEVIGNAYFFIPFLGAVFLAPAFFGAAFFAAVFFAKAPGTWVSIIFFTSSNEIPDNSSAVSFSPLVPRPNFSIFLPKRIKGPQRPFSIEIFSEGHCCIYRFASFVTFFPISSSISFCVKASKLYARGTLIYRLFHLMNGPNLPLPFVTGSPS